MKHIFLGSVLSLLLLGCTQPSELDLENDRREVLRIFESIDRQMDGIDEHWAATSDDIVYQAHGRATLEGKEAYQRQALEFFSGGSMEMQHELVDLESYSDVVIARGRASGRFQPPGDTVVHSWRTRNMFVFRRSQAGQLLIRHIMVNTES